jgi:hypothetical protein
VFEMLDIIFYYVLQSTFKQLNMKVIHPLLKHIRIWLVLLIVALLLSGITAFAIETELSWICGWWPEQESPFYQWLLKNYNAIRLTNEHFPALAYGYDWLAFAHIVIAIVFTGAYKDPVRNIWIFQFGIIACILIIPTAVIAGSVRGIPWFWQLIDISFGVIGSIPLLTCYRKIKRLEKINAV